MIVIVDDNETLSLFLKNILNEAGYDVIRFECAEECLFSLEQGLRPDMIIVDYILCVGGMDGIRLCSQIKKMALDKCIIICLTSGFFDADAKKLLTEEIGFNEFIIKPVIASEFVDLIKKYIPL